ncbi:MAG: RluA family pseudouridine synthase [Acidobacteriota bacterium]
MMQRIQFHIQQEEAGKRLDRFLASQLSALSRMRIANLLAGQACLVNHEPRPAGYHLAAGDFIELEFSNEVPTGMNPEAIALEILHEDEDIIVVVKPTGMLVHPNRSTKTGTLLNALAYHLNQLRIAGQAKASRELRISNEPSSLSQGEQRFATNGDLTPAPMNSAASSENAQAGINENAEAGSMPEVCRNPQFIIRPGLVHRLDRATSGVMVVAKNQRALSLLTKHFHKRKVEKRYLALVEGEVREDTGTIIAPIGHDETRKPPRRVMADGKYAETNFQVLQRLNGATLLELEPITGRTNQLRIHTAYIGHPIIGDDIYGKEVASLESGVASQKTERPADPEHRIPKFKQLTPDSRLQTPDSRLCLHAARLAFHHPVDGKWLMFNSPLPEDIRKILQQYQRVD